MKSLPLKLGIGIVVLFGLVILGFVLHEPLWWKWYEWKLKSDEKAERDAAVKIIGKKNEKAVPYIRKWLQSSDDVLVEAACRALGLVGTDEWKSALPELRRLLESPGHNYNRIAAAGGALLKHVSWDFEDILKGNPKSLAGMKLYRWRTITYMHRYTYRESLESGILKDPRAGFVFEDALKTENVKERRAKAAIVLGMLGKKTSVDVLIKALREDVSPDVRKEVALALGCIRDRRAVEPIRKEMMRSASPGTRRACAEALGAIGGQEAVDALVEGLANNISVEARRECAYRLGETGDRRACAPLLESVKKELDEKTRRESLYSIAVMGDFDMAEKLASVLDCMDDVETRWEIMDAMYNIGVDRKLLGGLVTDALKNSQVPRGKRRLMDLVERETIEKIYIDRIDREFRRRKPGDTEITRAIFHLGLLGDGKALEAISSLLERSDNYTVKMECMRTLGKIGGDGAVRILERVLDNESRIEIRKEAVYSLGHANHPSAARVLAEHVKKEKNRKVLDACIWVAERYFPGHREIEFPEPPAPADAGKIVLYRIGRLGKKGDDASLKELADILNSDGDFRILRKAADTLGDAGSAGALDMLNSTLGKKSTPARVRKHILMILAREGRIRDSEVIFRESRTYGDFKIMDYIRIMGYIGDAKAAWGILNSFKYADQLGRPYAGAVYCLRIGHLFPHNMTRKLRFGFPGGNSVRMKCLIASGRLKHAGIVEKLAEFLSYSRLEGFRILAARSLGRIGTADAAEVLVKALEADPGVAVRAACAVALGWKGNVAAVGPLVRKLKSGDRWDVRFAAAASLGEIGRPEAMGPLVEAIKNDAHGKVRHGAAAGLATLGRTCLSKEIHSALKSACGKGNAAASIALSWFDPEHDYSQVVEKHVYPHLDEFRIMADVYRGRIESMEKLIDMLPLHFDQYKALLKACITRMPTTFSECAPGGTGIVTGIQSSRIKKWYGNNKHRLAWDAGKRRYYLKPEKEAGKKE